MAEGWSDRARPHHHRVHRTEHEADDCPFHPEQKHFRYLPPYPPLRRKRVVSDQEGPSSREQSTKEDEGGEDEEEAEQDVHGNLSTAADDHSSVLSSVSSSILASPIGSLLKSIGSGSSRHDTPGPEAPVPEAGYPTPFSQELQKKDYAASPAAYPEGTPTPGGGFEVEVHMAKTRLQARHDNTASSVLAPSINLNDPLPPPDIDGALPGPPHRSIEAGSPSPLVLVPATETPPPRSDTRELSDLRRCHSDLMDELRDQTFTTGRLRTRNRIHVANAHVQDRRLYDMQAELQLAHGELDSAQAQASRERADAVTARRICKWSVGGLLLLILVYVLWCWVNGVEYEYIAKRLREFYGLDE